MGAWIIWVGRMSSQVAQIRRREAGSQRRRSEDGSRGQSAEGPEPRQSGSLRKLGEVREWILS